MRRVVATDHFVARLRALAVAQADPTYVQERIEAVARQIAAGRPARWTAFHRLHGAYDGYWSFKPFSSNRDFMVLCSLGKRDLLLEDLGAHTDFFTKGVKTRPQ